ncbi:MAG: hypothetical protein U1F56_23875 [Rubrivivax sp.]
MFTSPEEMRALQRVADLEAPLVALEDSLDGLAQALRRNDAGAIESTAAELHRALARAMDHFTRAARQGGVPMALRQRLALAGGQVAAQREALARATASLDRAIDVLLPGHGAAPVYGLGAVERPRTGPALQA